VACARYLRTELESVPVTALSRLLSVTRLEASRSAWIFPCIGSIRAAHWRDTGSGSRRDHVPAGRDRGGEFDEGVLQSPEAA
jgi:hypothetical protein